MKLTAAAPVHMLWGARLAIALMLSLTLAALAACGPGQAVGGTPAATAPAAQAGAGTATTAPTTNVPPVAASPAVTVAPGSTVAAAVSAAPASPAAASTTAVAPASPVASGSPAASPVVAQASPDAQAAAPRTPIDEAVLLTASAYNALQDRFFRPLDSRTLLQSAWDGARRALSDQRRAIADVPAPRLSGDREGDLARFSESFRALLTAAGSNADTTRTAMMASSAMIESVGEQHTVFLPPEQFNRFRSSLTSEQGSVGLGILISGQSAPFTIGSLVPGAPAEKAGVHEGDQIERIDGQDLSRRSLTQVSEMLRGEAGQPVTLSLRRAPGQAVGPTAGRSIAPSGVGGEALEVMVTRERFVVPPLTMRVLPEGLCHFRLTSFPVAFAVGPTGRTVAQDLDHYLEQCEQAGGRAWIMDLRQNGGGASLSQVLGRFLDVGPILVERDKSGARYEQATDGHLFRVQRPLVVLIDNGSASASEAFASAVGEYKRGVVMGQKTAGALNTGNIVPLPLGAGMMVAIREVFSGKNEIVIDEVGVSPSVRVDFSRDAAALPRQVIEQALNMPADVGPQAELPRTAGVPLSEAELRRRIEPIQLRAEDAEAVADQQIRGDLAVDTLHYYANDSPQLQAGRDRAVRLGWLGGFVRWMGAGFPPPYAVDVELYRDADGAHRDFREIYEPGEPRNAPQWRDVDPPIRLGDDTRALIGTGQNEGRIWIGWRRGSATYVVARTVTPGEAADFAPLVRLAQIIDGRAQQTPP